VLPETKLNRGDTCVTNLANTDRAIAALGYADRPTDVTDMVWPVPGPVGGLIGAIEFQLPVPITLFTLARCWRAVYRLAAVREPGGRVPTPSQWFMNSVGLTMFIAVVGIRPDRPSSACGRPGSRCSSGDCSPRRCRCCSRR
jgi:putative transport protein